MESVGRLAGGVAHDFNNLLMGIMGYAELCRDALAADHPIREWLEEITRDAQRSADITRQLLAFARKQAIAPKILDLNDALMGMLKMLRRLIGEDIDLAWMPGAKLWPVKLDPSQIDQTLANLCVNARDAIGGAGKLSISTANVTLAAADCAHHAGAVPGDYVRLAVSDDGCGMSADVKAHIFEPFFTTKEVGKGTGLGLGLATVYGIVTQNHGFINVDSTVGKGTTFAVYFPRFVGNAAEASAPAAANVPRGRGETVLLVEDEKSLRVTLALFLNALGYKALVAENPAAALALATQYPGAIQLLLTDVVMPGQDGRHLADQLAGLKPGLKVLFMSGYTADVVAQHGILDPVVRFIGKPFSRDELARKVHEVLDSGNAAAR
jgi:CheY-like chemotaxis protein